MKIKNSTKTSSSMHILLVSGCYNLKPHPSIWKPIVGRYMLCLVQGPTTAHYCSLLKNNL
jgi:hypothetical protein